MDLYLFILTFIIGITVGSFLNVLILRLPKGEDVIFDRSHCGSCEKIIHWYENIPLISYIFLRGKCSKCNSRISLQYPMIELITGLFALLIIPKYISSLNALVFIMKLSVFSIFLTIFVIDLRHKIIPNILNILLFVILLLTSVLTFSWQYIVFGIVIGVGFPSIVTWAFYKLKGEIGLGMGDIKLYGALGAYLGPIGIIHNIFLSCFLGSFIVGSMMILGKVGRRTKIAFGPFIVIIAFFQFFYPEYFSQLMSLFIFT
tara:strand:+ start:237039 stop:237815 length:777 start_codon:yes stop_codon:yes gene_type:complete